MRAEHNILKMEDGKVRFRRPEWILAEHRLLKLAFKFVMNYNKSKVAPYHSTWHMMCVMKCVDWLVRNEKALELYETEDELDELALLLAALFHDMNHSAGAATDDVNVEAAKYAFDEFISEVDDDVREEWLKKRVHSLLDATQYPYVIPDHVLTHDQLIMRDADMMYAYQDCSFRDIVIGLSTEMPSDPLSAVKRQITFHNNSVMRTTSAKAYKEFVHPELVYELSEYARILE
jgi:hypothetical protein